VRKDDASTGFGRAERRIQAHLDNVADILGTSARWHLVTRGYMDRDVVADVLAAHKTAADLLTTALTWKYASGRWQRSPYKEKGPETAGSFGRAAISVAFPTP